MGDFIKSDKTTLNRQGTRLPNIREPFEGMIGSARNQAEVERTLGEITSRASANAEGKVGVGLSVVVDGTVRSVGATTFGAQTMDEGQATDGDGPCLHALRMGRSVAVADYADDGRWPRSSDRAADVGIRSSLSLPLKTSDDVVLGALNVYSDSADAFSVATGSSLGAFAAQATTSLFLLGELQEQRDDKEYVTAFSHTMQASLRTVLPDVPGMDLFGRSVPSAARASVSGDWYDALLLPDNAVGLVIGDVMGHDIPALAAMAQLRTMVRAGAWLGHPPDEVIAMTDELAHLAGIEEIATLFHGRLVRTGETARLEYCNAGHLHPLLRDPDGSVTVLEGGHRILLGALGIGAPPAEGRTARIEMPPGSILLLYTDGLVEGNRGNAANGTEQIIDTLAGFDASGPLSELTRQLLDVAGTRDDTTVFTVRIH